jgi:hypothetical protein
MGILVVFAAFSSIGFGRSLAAPLWMAIALCAVIGTMRREAPFGLVLNHWDETARGGSGSLPAPWKRVPGIGEPARRR